MRCAPTESSETIPFGLAWSSRLFHRSLDRGLSQRALYTRRLGAGMLAISVPSSLLGAGMAALTGAPVVAVTLACLGVLFCVGLWGFLRFPSSFPWMVQGALVLNVGSTIPANLGAGGVLDSGANVIWALCSPVVAMLLLGKRHAVVWYLIATGVCSLLVLASGTGVMAEGSGGRPHLLFLVNWVLFGAFLMVSLVWFVEQRDIAEGQADRLLTDVLPQQIADRLRQGQSIADSHPAISVLFADLVGFTPLAAELPPQELVRMLDDLFRELDALVERHGVEKIKTIGDCYMVAAGVPLARADHCQVLARLALDMREVVAGRAFAGRTLSLRIGLHTGPAVAGVIGAKRFLYDLWGDTVNVASRLETASSPGEILVSEEAHAALADQFLLEARGAIAVKGRGTLQTFWLRGRRTSASEGRAVA